MKTCFLCAVLTLLGISSAALAKGAPDGGVSDSEVQEQGLPIADPYILYYNDRYYAYGTNARGFAVYISSDLKHWRKNAALALSP